jgi:hypothetical protein
MNEKCSVGSSREVILPDIFASSSTAQPVTATIPKNFDHESKIRESFSRIEIKVERLIYFQLLNSFYDLLRLGLLFLAFVSGMWMRVSWMAFCSGGNLSDSVDCVRTRLSINWILIPPHTSTPTLPCQQRTIFHSWEIHKCVIKQINESERVEKLLTTVVFSIWNCRARVYFGINGEEQHRVLLTLSHFGGTFELWQTRDAHRENCFKTNKCHN